jgi:hypothetical protein
LLVGVVVVLLLAEVVLVLVDTAHLPELLVEAHPLNPL